MLTHLIFYLQYADTGVCPSINIFNIVFDFIGHDDISFTEKILNTTSQPNSFQPREQRLGKDQRTLICRNFMDLLPLLFQSNPITTYKAEGAMNTI